MRSRLIQVKKKMIKKLKRPFAVIQMSGRTEVVFLRLACSLSPTRFFPSLIDLDLVHLE